MHFQKFVTSAISWTFNYTNCHFTNAACIFLKLKRLLISLPFRNFANYRIASRCMLFLYPLVLFLCKKETFIKKYSNRLFCYKFNCFDSPYFTVVLNCSTQQVSQKNFAQKWCLRWLNDICTTFETIVNIVCQYFALSGIIPVQKKIQNWF